MFGDVVKCTSHICLILKKDMNVAYIAHDVHRLLYQSCLKNNKGSARKLLVSAFVDYVNFLMYRSEVLHLNAAPATYHSLISRDSTIYVCNVG